MITLLISPMSDEWRVPEHDQTMGQYFTQEKQFVLSL
jgi:hypothetical protein